MTPKRGVVIKKSLGSSFECFDQGQMIPIPYYDGWTNQ